MGKLFKVPGGEYLVNSEDYEIRSDEFGRPILCPLNQGGGGSIGDFKADGTVPMTGNLNMNGKSIIGVHSISNTNTGLAIESETSLNNHKITGLLDPTADQDAATKKYVDDHSLLGSDGLIDTDLNMNERAIINAHKISTDGPAPLYIGATIEAAARMHQD